MNSDNPESPSVVYGIHAVEELLANRLESIDHVYFDADKKTVPLFGLLKICRRERLAYNLVPAIRIARLAGTEKHQGVVALCSLKPYGTAADISTLCERKINPLFLIAASIEDPGNLGAIIRSAVAFGVDALLLERKNTAPLTPAVAKASAGMVEHLTIIRPKNLEAIVKGLAEKGFVIAGGHAGKGDAPGSVDFGGPAVVVLGGEHRGIPPYLERLCTAFAAIPIDKRVPSLNVSAAAAVLLYECARQRTITS